MINDTYKPVQLEENEEYQLKSGGWYLCLKVGREKNRPVLQNEETGWTFIAVNPGKHSNGTIEWDYSLDGHFEKVRV